MGNTCSQNQGTGLDELHPGLATSYPLAAPITADGQAVKWLNDLLALLWPDMEKVALTICKEKITPILQEKAPDRFGLKEIHFSKFDLGKKTPKIHRLACVPTEAFGGARCHLFVDYDSDMHVELEAGSFTMGMKSFKISGEAVVLVRPVIKEIHGCVGGCTFYFSNRPQIEMDFTGLANVADFGGISDLVRNTMSEVLAQKIVLPNAVTQLVGYTDAAVYPLVMGPPHPPIGVLRVTTVKAEGIKSGDWHLSPFSQAVDDNYIKFAMGNQEWKAPTARMNETNYFFVHDSLQRLSIDVYDEDKWTADDYLGKVGDWTAEQAQGHSDKLLHLHDPDDPQGDAGHLQFTVEYLKTLPRELPSETDMCLIVLHFKEVFLPSSEITGKIALTCKIGETEKKTPAAKPLGGAMRKSTESILKDVKERLEKEDIEASVIDRVTKLEGLQIEKGLMKAAINCHQEYLVSFATMRATDKLSMELTLVEEHINKQKEKVDTPLGGVMFELQDLINAPAEEFQRDIEIPTKDANKAYTVQVSAQICALQIGTPPTATQVDSIRDDSGNHIGTDEASKDNEGNSSMRIAGRWNKKKKAKAEAEKKNMTGS